MKKTLKKDNTLKKFIIVLIISLCAFGLCAGAITAMGNTKKQLRNSSSDVITEKEIVEFISDTINELKNFKIVY